MKPPVKILLVLILLLPLIFGSLINFSDTDDPRIVKIISQLSLFRVRYAQQKVYVHTDKEVYMAGETVWMKAYLVRAASLMPDSISKDIFIDLLDYNNKSVRNMILRSKNGFSVGDLSLSDTLPEGNYQIRAYTNWMRNFDEDFFFHKTICIRNPNYENVVTKGRLKDIKKFNRTLRRDENKYAFQLFPEGGYLVYGLPCKIAFTSESLSGLPVNAKGILIDNKGKEVVTFASVHEGMGSFDFIPQPGLRYSVKITFEKGKTHTYDLPQAMNKGLVMTVDPFAREDILIKVFSNRPVSENIASNEVILVAQSRGLINYISKGEVRDKPVISKIPKKVLPAGITQITLFDGRGEPLCERLVFINPQAETRTNLVSISTEETGDSVIGNIRVTNTNGDPVKGSLSLSVLETLKDRENPQENILTGLLLTSDLKGRIDNPSYYFSDQNPDALRHLDLVMLTHGWRRFVWKDIMANKFPLIFYPLPGGISISGRITRDFFGIPISNSKVILSILRTYNDQFQTTTDSRGRFEFPIMDYEDTIDVKIEAFKPSGGKGVQIILGDTLLPGVYRKPYPSLLNETFSKQKIRANNRKEKLAYKSHFKEKPEEEDLIGKIHNTPNDVIHVGQDASNYSNILQYMQGRVPGVNITGNRVIIRGINTIYGNTDPLFLMDGVPIDANAVTSINPSDISTIEILKGPEASIYGSRGANGVIAFYSQRGHFMKRGVIEFGMLGYHKVREFYVPTYDSDKYNPKDYHIPRTLYWNPSIVTDDEGKATVRFKKKFSVEKTITTLEGMTYSGNIIHFVKE